MGYPVQKICPPKKRPNEFGFLPKKISTKMSIFNKYIRFFTKNVDQDD